VTIYYRKINIKKMMEILNTNFQLN